MTTYNTSVTQILTVQQPNPNYIVGVRFNVSVTDGIHSVSSDGYVEFNVEEKDNFISYDSLTEEIIVEWINNVTNNLESYYTKIDEQITKLSNPPAIPQSTELPWITVNVIPAE